MPELDENSTIDEVLAEVVRVETKHITRKYEHELDHSLWRLDQYILDELEHNTLFKKEDYPSFTSNAPRTLSRVVMAMATKNTMLVKTTLPPDVSPEEEDLINNNERLVLGSIHENNRVRNHRGDATLQWDIGWYVAHRGGVILRPIVVPGDRNQFRLSVFDPYECAWEKGEDCISFFVRHYKEELELIKVAWDTEDVEADTNDLAEIYDCWWVDKKHQVWNAVMTRKLFLKKPTVDTAFECNPVYVIRTGGAPSNSGIGVLNVGLGGLLGAQGETFGRGAERSRSDTSSDQWESIYTSVRQTIGWMNRAVTLFSIYLRNGAIGPWIYKGDKNKQIGKAMKPFSITRIGQDEDFGPVSMPEMAGEAKEFLEMIRGEWQKAGVSDIVFGDVPFTLSGFGMTQLRGAVEILINGIFTAMERSFEVVGDEVTKQFVKTGGRKKIKIKGFDGLNKPFLVRLKPSDITTDYMLKATLRQGLPKDNILIGQAANMWKQAGAPTQKIYEDVFEFQDSGDMTRRRITEMAEQMPEVLLSEAVEALIKQDRPETAKLVLMLTQGMQGGQGGETEGGGPISQALPGEVSGAGEQSGLFPDEPTGRPPGV